MTTFQMKHEMDMTAEKFWELFFNNDLQKKVFLDALQFPKWEIIDFKDGDKEVTRTVKAQPKMDAPGPVAKLLGDNFGYTEKGTFDKATKVYKFVITPTSMAEKLKNEGTVRIEAKGDKCLRIVDVVAEAKIFGVGGMVEKMTEKQTRDGWDRSAAYLNKYVKENP